MYLRTPTPAANRAETAMPDRIRRRIDKTDRKILRLLGRRFRSVDEIARVKERLGLEVFQPERIDDMIRARRALAGYFGLNPGLAEKIYRAIIAEAMEYEKSLGGKSES